MVVPGTQGFPLNDVHRLGSYDVGLDAPRGNSLLL